MSNVSDLGPASPFRWNRIPIGPVRIPEGSIIGSLANGMVKPMERTPEVKAELAQREAEAAARIQESAARMRAYANNDVAYFGPEMVAAQQASHPATTASTPPVTPASEAKPQRERIIFPNISSLTPELAADVYKHVQYMIERYGTEGKELVAMNGEIATESVEVYQSWLAGKAGISV